MKKIIGNSYKARTIEYDGQQAGEIIAGIYVGDYDGVDAINTVGLIPEDHHLSGIIFCELMSKIK